MLRSFALPYRVCAPLREAVHGRRNAWFEGARFSPGSQA